MSPEAQIISLFTALGWTNIEWYSDNQGPDILHGLPPVVVGLDANGEWEAQRSKHTKKLPDLNDLNVIHEVEKAVIEDDSMERVFQIELTRACGNNEKNTVGENFKVCIHASAAQRCEAILKTLGKWVE